MTHRCLHLPRVVMPRDPETVCAVTPTEDPGTYFETVMSYDEARRYGLELLMDAERAKHAAEANARYAKKANRG